MAEAADILSTGVPGLDAILNGGLNRRALTLIIGAAGAGKTVLASQILFHAARQGLQTVVFTSYSEGNDQYIDHLGTFDFFDPSLISNTVQLFSLQSHLAVENTSPATAILHTLRSTAAKVVLIDGFQSITPSLEGEQSTRELLAGLARQLRYLDATVLITMAGNARDAHLQAEVTVADVIIGLQYTVEERRHVRLLEVVKQRGRAQLRGVHSYNLDSQGVSVFPRLEAYPQPEAHPRTLGRAPFGLPTLDTLLGGGFNTGTTALIAGAPGVGKTTLGIYWALAGAQADATSLIVTFGEHLEQLQRKAAAFGLNLQEASTNGTVRVLRIPATDLDPDYVAMLILRELAAGPVRRLVIDDIGILLHELGNRSRSYLSALNDILYGADITSLYLLEIPAFDGLRVELANTPLALLGDNTLVIQQYEIGGVLRRLLAVLRMRLSFFDQTLRELVLDKNGVRVLGAEESGQGVLAAGAKVSGGIAPKESPTVTDDSIPEQ